MFGIIRHLDKILSADDNAISTSHLAEALQQVRTDAGTAHKYIAEISKRLSHSLVQVRIKACNLLLYLVENGPSYVLTDAKLYSQPITDCITWRGQPHPVHGFEPYNDLRQSAQKLLDILFESHSTPHQKGQSSTQFATSTTPSTSSGANYSIAVSSCSYEQGSNQKQNAVLEPRNLDPNNQSTVKKVINKVLRRDQTPKSQVNYGSIGSESPPPDTLYSNPTYDSSSSQYGNKHGQFDRLENEVSWATPKSAKKSEKAPKIEETPAQKLLKITGGRALPTNGELTIFKQNANEDSIEELMEGLKNTDWKVKVRAIAGLDAIGSILGYGPIANCKNDVAQLLDAPQASLKGFADKFYNKIKDVEPEALPEAPSAFNFGSEENQDEENNEENLENQETKKEEEEVKQETNE